MKKRHILIFTLIAIFAFGAAAFARPADSRPFTVTQSNGEKIVLCKQGNEFAHWTATKEGGYAVVCKGGNWYFAKEENGVLVSTGVLYSAKTKAPADCKANYSPPKRARRRSLGDSGKATLSSALQRHGKAALPASSPVISGERKILFIRVNFKDEDSKIKYRDINNYSTMFDTTEGAKSVARYYIDQSGGDNSATKLTIKPCDIQPAGGDLVTVAVDMNHPGKYLDYKIYLEKCGGDEDKAYDKAHKAKVALANAVLEQITRKHGKSYFAQYDTNKDGRISCNELCVYLIMGGYDSEPTNEHPNAVWAHVMSSYDESYGSEHVVKASGKLFETLTMAGEREYNKDEGKDEPCTMLGTVCHELGHQLLNLPDLYDTASDELNGGMGDFSLMAGGAYGCENADEKRGSCPVNLDAWSKTKVGWAKAVTKVTKEEEQKLTFTKNNPLRIEAPASKTTTKQYFLAELRDPNSGWDKGLAGLWETTAPKAGILVLHIDGEREKIAADESEDGGTWNINLSNSEYNGKIVHQGVLPICADNSLKYAEECENACANETLWYGENSKANELTPSSTPNSNFYSNLYALKPDICSHIALTDISKSNGDEMTATLRKR